MMRSARVHIAICFSLIKFQVLVIIKNLVSLLLGKTDTKKYTAGLRVDSVHEVLAI